MRAGSYDGPLQKMYADAGDPWKVLVSCILLNLTNRSQVNKVIDELFDRWPNPQTMAAAPKSQLMAHIATLGLADRRSDTLRLMSEKYIERLRFSSHGWLTEHEIAVLPGIGPYARDSYRIFVLGDTSRLESGDRVLAAYLGGLDGPA